MVKDRYLHLSISSDLKEKMVFVGGPRQVGKTTLARHIGNKDYARFAYLNWDYRRDRQDILAQRFAAEAKLLVFDELHKYSRWKNYLKGEFDKNKERFHILVTGSARLDLYRRGGDSLMGRYHYYRLHPFSLAEALGKSCDAGILQSIHFSPAERKSGKVLEQLLEFGGFPEPFLSKDSRTLRRFHNERVDRLVREDIRDLEVVRDISSLQVLVELLPQKVGSLLSLNALREDLKVAHKTVSVWMDILERFYYHFRIYPFISNKIKSLRKEPKLYLCDWSEVRSDSARLENLVASHLLKLAHFLHDVHGYRVELHFLRDLEGREVDFLLSIDRKPWISVEVKLSDRNVDKNLRYFVDKLKIPYSFQVIMEQDIDTVQGGIRVISADKFLGALV